MSADLAVVLGGRACPSREVPRSDLPRADAVHQRDYLGGPICMVVSRGDSLAGLSCDQLLIGRPSSRKTTKRLVSGLLSLDSSRRGIWRSKAPAISKNAYYLRPQQDSNLRTRLRRPWAERQLHMP